MTLAEEIATLEIHHRKLEDEIVWCAGQRRTHTYARQLYRLVNAGGQVGIGVACARCGGGRRLIDQQRLRAHGLDLDHLPMLDDRSTETRCVRCGRNGAEEHHWAPQALFEDADAWPTDPLCPACHARWHRKTLTNGVREVPADKHAA